MLNNAHRQTSLGSSSSTYSYNVDENDTHDSFSRKMISEMRADRTHRAEAAAAWRSNNIGTATNGNRPIAFGRARKARIRPRVELTVENVERVTSAGDSGQEEIRDRSVERFEREASVNSSGASRASEPAPNVPRTWARKAKRDHGWLKRLAADIQGTDTETPLQKNGPIDWSEVAGDLALPSNDESPTSRRSSRRGTPASASAAKMGLGIERRETLGSMEESITDFTLGDAITSTPARVTRNNRLAEIKRREIEEQNHASTGDRDNPEPPFDGLDEESKSRPASMSIRKSVEGAVSLENAFFHPVEKDVKTSRPVIKPVRRPGPSRQRSLFSGPMSPVRTLTKSASTVSAVDTDVQVQVSSPERPVHRRQDSRDLLRQWSRVVSGTPSPGRVSASLVEGAVDDRIEVKISNPAPIGPLGDSKKVTLPAADTRSIRSQAKPASITTSLSDRESLNPAPLRSLPTTEVPSIFLQPELHQHRSSSPIKHLLDPKTPVVTGAWIDTPGPAFQESRATLQSQIPPRPRRASVTEQTDAHRNGAAASRASGRQRPSSVPAIATHAFEPRVPSVPTSALANLLDRARETGTLSSNANSDDEDQANDHLGDATIQSLQQIIDLPVGSPEKSTADTIIRDFAGSSTNPDTRRTTRSQSPARLTTSEKLRAQEMRTLKEMNRRLVGARRNLRDAGDGISRVESLVERAKSQAVPAALPTELDVHSNKAELNNGPSVINKPKSEMELLRTAGKPSIKSSERTDEDQLVRFATHPFETLWLGVKRMIFLRPDSRSGHRGTASREMCLSDRLTWFGIAILSLLLWVLLEGIACATYCRPIYSTPNTPASHSHTSPDAVALNLYNLHPEAPTFPVVIPTLLLQNIQSVPVVSAPIKAVIWLLAKSATVLSDAFLASGAGLSRPTRSFGSGSAETIPTITKTFGAAAGTGVFARVTNAVRHDDVWEEFGSGNGDWGMGDDEYL